MYQVVGPELKRRRAGAEGVLSDMGRVPGRQGHVGTRRSECDILIAIECLDPAAYQGIPNKIK